MQVSPLYVATARAATPVHSEGLHGITGLAMRDTG